MASPGFLGLITSDIRAKALWMYEDTSWRGIVHTLLTDGTMAMILYRLMQACNRLHLAPLTMLFNKLNGVCCQCIIGRGADFGPGFVLIHSQGIVINTAVKGGSRLHLEHQVTIGANRGVSPVLGDDIFIGAGAKVIGSVSIGNRARIGANCVVTKNVPEGATVVGVPGAVVKLDSEGERA